MNKKIIIILDKKIYSVNEKKKYLKFINEKKNFFFHLFFNLNEVQDHIFYLLYDLLIWDKKKKWYLFKPYYLSFFYKFRETNKWLYVRLLNIFYKNNLKKNIYLKNFKIGKYWNNLNFFNLRKKVKKYYQFKGKIIFYKYTQYYFFIYLKNQYILYFYEVNFDKYFFKFFNFFKKSMYFFLEYYFKFFIKNKFVKKNNIIFIFLQRNYIFLKNCLNNIFLTFIFLKNILYIYIEKYFFIHLLKEKHKLNNFLFNFFYYLKLLKLIREIKIFFKLISKKRFRRKKNEKKKTKKIFIILKRKKRTNNQIIKIFLRKCLIKKQLLFNLVKGYFFNKNYNYKKFILKYFNFIDNYFLKYKNKLFIDIDILYIFYLPKKRNVFFISYSNDSTSNLWKNYFDKNNKIYFKNSELVRYYNNLGNIKFFNKLNIKNLYFFCIKRDVNEKKIKNKYYLLKNFIPLLCFIKKNFSVIIKNLDFVYNIYFWIIIFLKMTNKSKLFYIKKFFNINSFLKIIKILYNYKFNWFSIYNFDINLSILTLNNFILNLKCSFKFLLQEVCLYLYNNVFQLLPTYYEQSIFFKIKQIKNLNNIHYLFKGNISLENNHFLCLFIIKKSTNNFNFLKIISNFFFHCNKSILFIKKNIKLYWNLLELPYKLLDDYIFFLFNKKFLNNIKFFYIRYKNVFIICYNMHLKNIFEFILKNFIYFFLYHFLKFYLFFSFFFEFKKNQQINIFNYIILKKKEKFEIKSSYFSCIKLLFFYNFIKKFDDKLLIKPAYYLLNLPIVRILNYFYYIWNDIYYYYFINRKFLLFFRKILYKICFLTLFLKLKNKNKNLKFKNFKKIFNLDLYKNIYRINFDNVNKYIKKNNYMNFNKLLNKYKKNINKKL